MGGGERVQPKVLLVFRFHVSCEACCTRARHIHTDDLPCASQSRQLFVGAIWTSLFLFCGAKKVVGGK